MKVAYGYPLVSAPAPPDLLTGAAIAEIAVAAEGAGFGAFGLSDHPAPPQRWRQVGGHDALDPFVGLAFAAAATTRLRLLTCLVVLPYRNPFLVAKSVASLDVLSGGRVELGLGAGYLRPEFAALGVDFDERNTVFDDALAVLKQAWTGQPVGDIVALPRPAQRPHPPLWLGGNSMRTRRRVIEHGAGWLTLPNARASAHVLRSPALETVTDLRALLTDLRGRAPVMYCMPDTEEDHLPIVRQLIDLGVDWLYVIGRGQTVAQAREWIERYRESVLDQIVD
ncbi:MAG TPA: TIGR03619 family F420-dependent LLM class oxidoreductase [Pseudonocardiaceae bacterium]